jgi:hypothetical protein
VGGTVIRSSQNVFCVYSDRTFHFVWIFAGGDPPTAFLKKIGVGFGFKDLTTEGSDEAKFAQRSRDMANASA